MSFAVIRYFLTYLANEWKVCYKYFIYSQNIFCVQNIWLICSIKPSKGTPNNNEIFFSNIVNQ